MRKGGGKIKGNQFERYVCVALSLWVSNGEHKDCLWRSAMSGGRATIGRGEVRQSGDIASVTPEGHILTNSFHIECKCYASLGFHLLLEGGGNLLKFWRKTREQAHDHEKLPMLIARQNRCPIIICLDRNRNDNASVLVPSEILFIYRFRIMLSQNFNNWIDTQG